MEEDPAKKKLGGPYRNLRLTKKEMEVLARRKAGAKKRLEHEMFERKRRDTMNLKRMNRELAEERGEPNEEADLESD